MGERIVVCDDEVHITRAISIKLKKSGFDVETACNGQQGWEAIVREKPALLMTDFQMPRMSGMDLIQHVRNEPSLRGLPIIFLTAKGFEVDPEELAQKWNPIRVMGKPFSLKEVVEFIHEMIGASQHGQPVTQSVTQSAGLEN